MEMKPIPNGEIVYTVMGKGTVVKAIPRETRLSPFKTVIEYQYDVEIDGKVRRVFNTEISGHKAKTLHAKRYYLPQETEKRAPKRKNIDDVQILYEKAHELVLNGGVSVKAACKEFGIDLRSYKRRYLK